ncbi:MAG: hypothetical protein V1810_03415 [Candidatus Beckwithbacteria bacterium]
MSNLVSKRESKLIRVNNSLHQSLKELADLKNLTISALVEVIVKGWMFEGEELIRIDYFIKKYGEA